MIPLEDLKDKYACLKCGKTFPRVKHRTHCPFCGGPVRKYVTKLESEAQARLNRAIVRDFLKVARRLKDRAAALERDGHSFEAKAALELAEYLVEVAEGWGK